LPTYSGTTTFALSNGDAIIAAYARLQLRRTALLSEHYADAIKEANFLLSEIANKQPNLWTSEQTIVPLVPGTATYTLDAKNIMILSAFIRTTQGSDTNDRIISPISTTEYASYTNKSAQGFPTVYWFDRQIIPQITLWYVPDSTQTYNLYLQIVNQIDDAGIANGQNPQIPYRFYDLFVAGLAYRLAKIYKPELEQLRKADYMEAWQVAATQDVENVELYIRPSLNGYYGSY
jgi:hypothetical protein